MDDPQSCRELSTSTCVSEAVDDPHSCRKLCTTTPWMTRTLAGNCVRVRVRVQAVDDPHNGKHLMSQKVGLIGTHLRYRRPRPRHFDLSGTVWCSVNSSQIITYSVDMNPLMRLSPAHRDTSLILEIRIDLRP
ncbi:hypothetical protein J6590_033691 [Homalodisca vitripennis]|nr:hypothetical protein J6590_033691 [Homalodisca vitripennis]